MSCTPLPKLAWVNQLTRLRCLVVNAKFHFEYIAPSKKNSQPLLVSTSSKVLLERGSEKAFSEYLGVQIL